jgi:hypothetical protein
MIFTFLFVLFLSFSKDFWAMKRMKRKVERIGRVNKIKIMELGERIAETHRPGGLEFPPIHIFTQCATMAAALVVRGTLAPSTIISIELWQKRIEWTELKGIGHNNWGNGLMGEGKTS